MANYFDQYDTGASGNYFDQYDEAKPAPAPAEEPSTTETVIDAVKGNLDIPFGILGGALGAYGGPAGIVAGGGAGTAVGSALSDYLETGRVNLNDVSTDAATSVVFDVGTMGAFKYAKPILTKLGFKPDEIMSVVAQKFGKKSPTPPGGSLGVETVHKTGSPESLLSTQQLLRADGGSLAAFQTGKAGVARRVADGIGSIGVLSSQVYKGAADRNSAIIGKKLESLMNDGLLEATDDVGMLVHGIVKGGKEAAGTLYNKGMSDVASIAGHKVIPVVPIQKTLMKFLEDG